MLKRLLSLRAVLVTGKGGVGKTTVAASLARYAAQTGKRVLVAEIGSEEAATTSALAEVLGLPALGPEPLDAGQGLRAVALMPSVGHQGFLRDVLPMKFLADAAMKAGAIRRFLSAAPTFPEMGVLYALLGLVRQQRRDGSPEHELIVVDLPATGHALALAQIPASLLKIIPHGPIANAVREGLSLLEDAQRTAAVVVTLPETLPVSEAIELARGIREHKIPLGEVVVNRVPFDPLSAKEHAIVRALVAGKLPGPVLGARTLERIDRAKIALDRLGDIGVPLTTIQDVWFEGPRLSEQVASLMSLENP